MDPRPTIRQVVFDFGGVLIEWQPERILAQAYADPERRDRARREIFQHPDWLELDRGALSEQAAVARFAARTVDSVENIEKLMATTRESLRPKPDSVALLHELADSGVPIYGLSNMPEHAYGWLLAQHEFFARFDGIVVSARVGAIKPEPTIYEHLCSAFRLRPEESLFIDDMPANVEVARELGFHALRFESAQALRRHLSNFALYPRS
jgi:HAD superfamily hydrolase (TIGR01509 family)